jgi:hypothetical protein
MKNMRKILALLLLIIASSCVHAIDSIPNEITATSPTSSIQPSSTDTINSTPTSTATIRTLPIPLPLPTEHVLLDFSQTKQLIMDLLQTNGECSLPCIWGIPIGEQRNVVEGFFSNLYQGVGITRFDSSRTYIGNDPLAYDGVGYSIHFREDQTNFRFVIDTRYDQAGEVISISLISNAYVYTEVPGDAALTHLAINNETYQEITHHYSLTSILDRYGPPTQILFRATTYYLDVDPATFPMILVLYYEDMGFMVEYVFPRETIGINYTGCPGNGFFSIASVANDGDPLEDLVNVINNDWGSINILGLALYPTLEEATGESIQEFYNRFISGDENECISSPITYWETN